MNAPPPPTDQQPEQRAIAGAALRLVSMAAISAMLALVKLAQTRGVSIFESVFYRQLFAVPAILLLLARSGRWESLRTARPLGHGVRMLLGIAAMSLNFWTMTLLPLAEATTIFFAVPILTTVLAALVLKEPTGRHRWSAVVVGFIGVLIVVQPGGGALPVLGVAAGVFGALMTAAVTIQIRQLGRTEPTLTIVFWFSLTSLLPLGIAMLFIGTVHDPLTWAIIAGIGLLGAIGQLCLTGALRMAPVAIVLPMDYTGLIWSALYGYWLFAEIPATATWFGAPLIIASGIYIVWREHRLARRAAAIRPPVR
ncbi:DMT family transporter [Novosphingopyxis iocasae]|uniref:DMT family transporter n=1 Tax=Novosphingopyxis iocasae TaxID=2762729 RepID=UPI001FE7F9C3|nr:DMT family transporter [Novosphingopyxis iocasae]